MIRALIAIVFALLIATSISMCVNAERNLRDEVRRCKERGGTPHLIRGSDVLCLDPDATR